MRILQNSILCALLLALATAPAQAQDATAKLDSMADGSKIVTNAMMAGIGSTEILDTYLSPEKYSGTELRFLSHTTRERKGRRWSRQIVWQGHLSFTDNRANEGSGLGGILNFGYGVHRNWAFMGGKLNVKAGGLIDANLGFLYNTRNGNNPAQAKADVSLMPSVAAAYRFRLWDKSFMVRYEAAVPLVGLMFSPNYGQSYYEIFSQGNYDHNIIPTTIVSTPSLRHMLTLDFSLLKTTFWLPG